MMGLQTDEPYFIPGGLQGSAAACAKAARGAEDEEEEEEGAAASNIPDFSHFSNKPSLNGFSPWTSTASSVSPQLQSGPGASLPGLFHPHPLLSHHHHHPYYGPQAPSHAEHLAPVAASESRFVRCWEGATPASDAALSQVPSGFPACLPAQGDLSEPSPTYEAIKPESSPQRGSADDSSFASPAEVVLERLGTVEELGPKTEPKNEEEERKTPQQVDPGKNNWHVFKLRNVY